MSSHGNGFAADVPITDLDMEEDLDDFHIQDEESYNQFSSQVDIADLNLDTNSNFVSRGFSKVKSLFSPVKKNTKNGFSRLENDIEMANTGDTGDDHGLDFDFYKDNADNKYNNSVLGKIFAVIYAIITSKVFIYPILLTGASLLLIYIVVASQNDSDSQGPFDPMSEQEPEDHRMKPVTDLLTIVLSVEGLHSHFISDHNMPFLANLINSTDAVFAPFIRNVNPVSKVPSLWALSTGKYPAHNGIIGDSFYDNVSDSSFVKDDMHSKWWLSEPIWETVDKNNKHATAFNWPMVRISQTNEVDNDDGFHVRFEYREQLIKANKYLAGTDALTNEINLLLSSVNTLASDIRKHGLGPELAKSLQDLDKFISDFYDLIETLHLHELTNIIITSEGNYAPVTKERVISLESLIDVTKFKHIEGEPIVHLYPNSDDEQSINDLYNDIQKKWSNHPSKHDFKVYQKKDAETIYGGESNRIAPIIIVPNAGYLLLSDSTPFERDEFYVSGYTNNEMLSRGVFIATGPYFEKNSISERVLKPFDNVQIYNMICHSINIEPLENDGELNFLQNSDNYIHGNWMDVVKYPGVRFNMPIINEKSVIESRFTPPEPKSLKPITLIPSDDPADDERDDETPASQEDAHPETSDQTPPATEKVTEGNTEDNDESGIEAKIEHWWGALKDTVSDLFKDKDSKSE